MLSFIKNMATLVEIKSEIRELIEVMVEAENQEELEPILNELTQLLDKKIDNYLYMIRHFEQEAEMQRKEADRLYQLSTESQRKADWLKQTLKAHMEHMEIKRMNGTYGKASLCKNGGKAPVWFNPEIVPEDLPEELTLVHKIADKQAIRQLCEENGGELKIGDRVIAQILDRQSHLRIR